MNKKQGKGFNNSLKKQKKKAKNFNLLKQEKFNETKQQILETEIWNLLELVNDYFIKKRLNNKQKENIINSFEKKENTLEFILKVQLPSYFYNIKKRNNIQFSQEILDKYNSLIEQASALISDAIVKEVNLLASQASDLFFFIWELELPIKKNLKSFLSIDAQFETVLNISNEDCRPDECFLILKGFLSLFIYDRYYKGKDGNIVTYLWDLEPILGNQKYLIFWKKREEFLKEMELFLSKNYPFFK